MKNIFSYLFSFLLLSTTISLSAQEYCMKSPTGFGRNATGGAGGSVVKISTRTELSTALKASGASIIIITKDITFGQNEMINEIISNKTILALSGIKLVSTYRDKNGGILGFKAGSNNVIVRNIIFEGPGAYDVDGNDLLQNTGCNNLWVDHCEFYDGVDGNFDNTKTSDNITISWCKFGYKILPKAGGSGGSANHCFSNLVGGASNDFPSDGFYSITFQYCYWSDGCIQRMPRARNAELHILNCYYNITSKNSTGGSTSSLAIGLGAGSNGTTCYVEGTNFKKVSTVLDASYDKVTGKSVATNFINCLKGGSNSGTVLKPTYTYTALDVDNVEEAILSVNGAGATLKVSDSGEVYIGENEEEETLSVPANVNAISESNSVLVTWDAVANATSYKVILSTNGSVESSKTWDFSTWIINANNADANLVLDGVNPRFNYKNATSSEELKFAGGNKIPDTEGLLFSAGADTKLRLGFGTGMIYLNGANISIEIPCKKNEEVIVQGTSGNADATDRGFSVTGATINESGTSANIIGGIMKETGGAGTWSYIATDNNIIIKTITGGMNVTKITVKSQSGSTEEYIVTGETSKNISGLQPNTVYTYQVMAINGNSQSGYSQEKTISTQSASGIKSTISETWSILQQGNDFIVAGLDVESIEVRNIHGIRIISSKGINTINASRLTKGIYLITIRTKDNMVLNKKIVKK